MPRGAIVRRRSDVQPQRQPVREIMKRCCLLLGSIAALAFALQDVRAAPLDPEACGKLNGERLQLEFAGARGNLAKGPDWAKGNLSSDAIGQVRRLIEVDAQMLFRCTGFSLVNLTPDVDPDPDPPIAGLTKEDDGTPAKAEPKAKQAPDKAKQKTDRAKDKDNKAPAAKKPSAKQEPAAGSQKGPERAAAKPAPKPKTKLDDAYRPPQADPNADPFANKAKPAAK